MGNASPPHESGRHGWAVRALLVLVSVGTVVLLAEIEQFAEANEISTLSLLPAFAGEDDVDLWISPTDQHPNEKGHAIAAEAIADFLAERIAGATAESAPLELRTPPRQSPPTGNFE